MRSLTRPRAIAAFFVWHGDVTSGVVVLGHESSRHFLFARVDGNLIPWPAVTRRQVRGRTMTPDEMDKKIEFILEMQAQFAANLARS